MRLGPAFLVLSVALVVPASASAAVRQFAIPTKASRPLTIAKGPDGALWFTESAKNRIGRITRHGTVREFRLPQPGSGPGQIAVGPDGALWFTEAGGNRIGRITTAGQVSEFPIPTAQSAPQGLTE